MAVVGVARPLLPHHVNAPPALGIAKYFQTTIARTHDDQEGTVQHTRESITILGYREQAASPIGRAALPALHMARIIPAHTPHPRRFAPLRIFGDQIFNVAL